MNPPSSPLPSVTHRLLSLLILALVGASSARAVNVTVTTPADFATGQFYACEAAGAGAGGFLRLRAMRDFPAAAPPVWSLLGTMPVKREGHAAVVVGDRVYVIAGEQVPGYSAVASVWSAPLAGLAAGPPAWTKSAWEYGQVAGASKGLAVQELRAVAVGGRIYGVGGRIGSPLTPTNSAWSAPVDPGTGEPGPWRAEPSLPVALTGHALVHARGALFVLGGVNAAGAAVPFVFKAEIAPDGTLGPWTAPAGMPLSPCPPGGSLPCCVAGTCPGFSYVGAAAAGNSLMFFGGNRDAAMIPSSPDIDFNSYACELDDWNGTGSWQTVAGSSTYSLWNYQAVVVDGLAVTVGGANLGFETNTVSWSVAGLGRDSASPDRTRVMPPAAGSGGTRLFSPPAGLPVIASYHQVVTWQDGLFILGGRLNSGTADSIYRATLVPGAAAVNVGSYVSAPLDLGQPCLLKRVAWTVRKAGGADDDWALVQYRVADAAGIWSQWSPRLPDVGLVPAAPGTLVYASDAAGPRRVPLFPQRARWVQFAVVLYNDPGLAGEPEFDDFTVDADPAPAPPPLHSAVEAYPIPASDLLTVRFQLPEGGAVVTLRMYNAAAELVYEREDDHPSSGVVETSVPVRDMSSGAYVLRLTAKARGGGPGLVFAGRPAGSAEARIVVRHPSR